MIIRLRKLLLSSQLKEKVFFISLLFISFPVLAVGLFLVFNTKENMTRHYIDQTEAENRRVKSVLLDLTINIYNLSENFIMDDELMALLTMEYENETQIRHAFDSYKMINNILSKETSISDIRIYTNNSSIQYSNFIYCTEEIRQTDWYQTAASKANIFWLTQTRKSFGNIYYDLTLYRKIPLPTAQDFAILEITVSDNFLNNRIDNSSLPTIVCVNQGPIFYSPDRSLKGQPFPVTMDSAFPFYQFQGNLSVYDQEVIGAVSTLQPYRSDDFFCIVTYSIEALPYIQKLTLTYLIIVVFALLFLITYYVYREKRQKESVIYESQIREQKFKNSQHQMEFKVLTSQINPHFLYNALETIRMKAFTEGNPEVANAIKLLGRSLHYVLENTGTTATTLSKELEYTEIYLKIQKLRFKEKINYTIAIQPDLNPDEHLIFPLIVQPIVENAVSHGLSEVEADGKIEIAIYSQQDQFLYIEVTDNGTGMTPDKLESVRSRLLIKDAGDISCIGLYNIHQRIRLCCGPEFGLEIESSQNNGTKVCLRLPLNNMDYESLYISELEETK